MAQGDSLTFGDDRDKKIVTLAQFAQRLDRLRRESGKSYRILATATGLGFNTIAGYCRGRHLPQQSVEPEFLMLLAEIGVEDGEAKDFWLETLRQLRAKAERQPAAGPNPYRGLRPFETEDAGLFFGRTELTSRLLAEIAARRGTHAPLVVSGVSGSGKSSLLRAGLLPALAAGTEPVCEAATWPVLTMNPGARPLLEFSTQIARLARSTPAAVYTRLKDSPTSWRGLLPADTVPLVVVDQLEELFTLCDDEVESQAFLTALLDAGDAGTTQIVLAFRADFYGRVLGEHRLSLLLEAGHVVVGPLSEDQLRAAIVEPARAVGYEFTDGVVELLLRDGVPSRSADSTHEAGMLPMLAHTLHALIDLCRRTDPNTSVIGIDHYRAVGGVRGAIARTAEDVYDSLSTRDQALARSLFLRLVRTEHGVADTRRRVALDELFPAGPARTDDDLVTVFDRFVAHRLLTAGTGTVEISHEALLTSWPRLREWLTEDEAGRRLHSMLAERARAWRDGGRGEDDLFRGSRLAAADEWVSQSGPGDPLNQLEREFLDASRQRQREWDVAGRRRVRRRYQLLTAVVVLVLVIAGTALYARQVALGADQDRAAADRSDRLSASRQTAAKAERLADKDPGLAAQLALAAYRIAPTTEARSALLDSSVRPTPVRARATHGAATAVTAMTDALAIGTDTGHVQLRPYTGTRLVADLTASRPITALTAAADGTVLVAGDATGEISVWHPAALTGSRPQTVLSGTGTAITALAVSPDRRTIAAAVGSTIRLWQVGAEGITALGTLTGPADLVRAITFTPDSQTLVAAGEDRVVRLWDMAVPREPVPLATISGPTSKVFAVAVSPDGRILAAGTAAEHSVYLWDITDRTAPRSRRPPLTGPASWVNSLAFSPSGNTLAAGSADSFLWQWDTGSGDLVGTLPHSTPLISVGYRDERTLTALAADGITRTWTVPGPVVTGLGGQVFSVSFDRAGHTLAAGAGDSGVHVLDVTDSRSAVRHAGPLLNDLRVEPRMSGASVLTLDGRTVVAGLVDGSVQLWDVSDPARVVRRGPPLPVATNLIEAVVLAPDGRSVAVSSDDGTVHVVDIADVDHPVVTGMGTGPTETVYGIRFSPDGRYLAAASSDHKGYFWDATGLSAMPLLATVGVSDTVVYAIAYNARGTLAAFGAADYAVQLVDTRRPEHPVLVGAPLIGPVDEIMEISFHPSNDVLAVSSADGTIWLWDVRDPRAPRHRATLQASARGLLTVAFSPDGHTLAAGSRDGSVLLWDTDPESVIRRVCGSGSDPITAAEWAQFVPAEPYVPPCR